MASKKANLTRHANAARYTACLFFAEKTSARKGAALAGTILIMAKAPRRNGERIHVIRVPFGQIQGTPVDTWASPEYISRKCVPVTEEQARALHPELFVKLAKHDARPEYRETHAITVAEQFPARFAVQPANAGIVQRITGGRTCAQEFRRIYGD